MSKSLSSEQAPEASASDAQQANPIWNNIRILPLAFSSETMGFSVGVAGLWKKAGQPQASLFGSAVGSAKGTWLGFLAANNYTYSLDSRWMFSARFYEAHYKQFDYYLGVAASNDSKFSDRIKADSRDSHHYLSANFILPLGAGVDNPIMSALTPYRQVTGDAPWSSGISSLEFRPFYKARKLSNQAAIIPSSFANVDSIWGLETHLRWDNRDSAANPTNGNLTEFIVTNDFGDSNSASWWKWEFSHSWYWGLVPIDGWIDTHAFAFNIYTADTPSWNDTSVINGELVYHRPPEFAGVNLGGLSRLRSFQSNRFIDRSAISYAVEYRMLPKWQPLGALPVFNWYYVPWWQWVLFAETGRVAPSYDLVELHRDLKWTAGVGMRFQVEGIVARAEMAVGSEEGSFKVMINQPF